MGWLLTPSQNTSMMTCKFCAKIFRTATGLRQHMRLHTGQSFVCQVCGMELTTAVNLRRHQQTHLSERPTFTCELCGRTFNRRDNRDGHQRLCSSTAQHPRAGKVPDKPASVSKWNFEDSSSRCCKWTVVSWKFYCGENVEWMAFVLVFMFGDLRTGYMLKFQRLSFHADKRIQDSVVAPSARYGRAVVLLEGGALVCLCTVYCISFFVRYWLIVDCLNFCGVYGTSFASLHELVPWRFHAHCVTVPVMIHTTGFYLVSSWCRSTVSAWTVLIRSMTSGFGGRLFRT